MTSKLPFVKVAIAFFVMIGLCSVASADTYAVKLISLENADGDPQHDLYFEVATDGKSRTIPGSPSKENHFIVNRYAKVSLASMPGIWQGNKPEPSDLVFWVNHSFTLNLWDYNTMLLASVPGNKGVLTLRTFRPGTYTTVLPSTQALSTHYTLTYSISRVSGSGGGSSSAGGSAPSGATYRVSTRGGITLMSGPGTNTSRVMTLSQGEYLTYLSQSGQWRRVRITRSEGGTTGWVRRSDLEYLK